MQPELGEDGANEDVQSDKGMLSVPVPAIRGTVTGRDEAEAEAQGTKATKDETAPTTRGMEPRTN